MKSIQTHKGKIPISELGPTLVHEHIFNKFPHYKQTQSEEFTIRELKKIENRNIKTIVDLTTYTTPNNYTNVLKNVNLNIVCCIGFYLSKYIPASYKNASVSQLISKLAVQIENGRGRSTIKPGILKIAGRDGFLSAPEKRYFKTVAELQKRYNLPIATHSPKGALVHLNELVLNGANPNHIFISHMDLGLSGANFDFNTRLREMFTILDKGAFVLFAEFGNRLDTKSQNVMKVLKMIEMAKKRGYINQLMISTDSNWRWRYGELRLKGASDNPNNTPKTYDYVFTQIMPMLRKIGFDNEDFRTMCIKNPYNFFNLY